MVPVSSLCRVLRAAGRKVSAEVGVRIHGQGVSDPEALAEHVCLKWRLAYESLIRPAVNVRRRSSEPSVAMTHVLSVERGPVNCLFKALINCQTVPAEIRQEARMGLSLDVSIKDLADHIKVFDRNMHDGRACDLDSKVITVSRCVGNIAADVYKATRVVQTLDDFPPTTLNESAVLIDANASLNQVSEGGVFYSYPTCQTLFRTDRQEIRRCRVRRVSSVVTTAARRASEITRLVCKI